MALVAEKEPHNTKFPALNSRCSPSLEGSRFLLRQLRTHKHGGILMGTNLKDLSAVADAVLEAYEEKVVIAKPQTTDNQKQVFPKTTVFLWDSSEDLFKNLHVLHWMLKTLGCETKFETVEDFVTEFGNRKARLKLFCSRVCFVVKRGPPKKIVEATSESSSTTSELYFARTEINTQQPLSFERRFLKEDIIYAEGDTEDMSPLTVEYNVYEADTISFVDEAKFEPGKAVQDTREEPQTLFPHDEEIPILVEATQKPEEPPKPVLSFKEDLRKMFPDAYYSSSSSGSPEDLIPRYRSRYYPDAQDPCASPNYGAYEDPDRFTSFVGNPYVFEEAKLSSSLSDSPVELDEPAPPPVISVSSGSTKRSHSPDLFADDSSNDCFIVEPVKDTKTEQKTDNSPIKLSTPISKLCANSPWDSDKKADIFEITTNDIFSNVIQVKENGEMSPVDVPKKPPPPKTSSTPYKPRHPLLSSEDDDDEYVESSQIFNFRTPKKRTTPCSSKGSSKARKRDSDGWYRKFVEGSPRLAKSVSPRTPKTSRKRLFSGEQQQKVQKQIMLSPDDLFS